MYMRHGGGSFRACLHLGKDFNQLRVPSLQDFNWLYPELLSRAKFRHWEEDLKVRQDHLSLSPVFSLHGNYFHGTTCYLV